MIRPICVSLLAALAGPVLAGHPSHPQPGPSGAAAAFAFLIEAHHLASGGSGLLPLRLAPAPRRSRLCLPGREADTAGVGPVIPDRSTDARLARLAV
ncbi:MAG: hypothetical protein AMJ64_03175 [Betaproteobacteria bacterium SG8_39]|nr:MAG: hypothetical protein AMJ64_03175 [Betaproteobacteria bacterium SG8_39]